MTGATCASCNVAAKQAKSTGCLATCSECGTEFQAPLRCSTGVYVLGPGVASAVVFDRALSDAEVRRVEREFLIVPLEPCARCLEPPADTVEALLRDLSRAARWLSLASPRATSLEPRAPGSTGSTTSPAESAVTLDHGRHVFERAQAVAAREGGSVAAALWWMLERAPQLELSPGMLPELIAQALGTEEQKRQWRPAPPPKPAQAKDLGITPEVLADLEQRFRKAREGGFLGGTIWGRDLVARVLDAWRQA